MASGFDASLGRWPANVVLDEEAAAMLDAQTGVLTSGGRSGIVTTRGLRGNDFEHECHNPIKASAGGPSRFFYCAKASRAERNAGLWAMPERNNMRVNAPRHDEAAKHQTRASNHHPTVKPVAVMRWLVRLVAREGDTVLDPFTGSGTTGVACMNEGRNFIGIEREAEYVEIARRRIEAAAAQTRLPV